jgi:LAGLIDADG endonuclease
MKASDASYLAGFLDGDGSIHFQLVRQQEYRFGYYIRASMSLSQSTSARHGLEHLQRVVGGGYLRDRGTGMSDLVVTSRPLLIELFQAVRPYVSSSESTYAERSGCCRSSGLGSTPRSSCRWRDRWTPSLP